jgi:methanethiol S-methyltransferase
MLGFLLQWPTLLTLLMFPVLVVMYVRLTRMEERDTLREFGDQYRAYMQRTVWKPMPRKSLQVC